MSEHDHQAVHREFVGSGESPLRSRRLRAVVGLWAVSLLVTGWLVLGDRRVGDPSVVKGAAAVAPLLATNAALLRWSARGRVDQLRAASTTRRLPTTLTIAAAVLVLFPLAITGLAVLVPVAAAAAGVLVVPRRHRPTARELAWALVLGVVAAVAGVLDGVAKSAPGTVLFGLLQLPLVALALLAGWTLARRSGWNDTGVGQALVVSEGARAGLRAFLFGVVLALPWAFGNVVNGAPATDVVVRAWQPLAAALQPAVAEEAWARAFLVVALFVLFARSARAPTALGAAVIVAVTWFAFLHAPADPLFVLLLAAVYVAPMAWLYLRCGLEAAIGFHFAVDLARFAAAYLAFRGLWFA